MNGYNNQNRCKHRLFAIVEKLTVIAVVLFLLACAPVKEKDIAADAESAQAIEKSEGIRGDLVPQLPHAGTILSVDYAEDHDFFLTGSKDNSIKVWQSDGQLIRTAYVGIWAYYIEIFDNDKYALIASRSGDVAVMRIIDGQLFRLPKINAIVNSVALSPNGLFYAFGTTDGEIIVNDINGRRISQFNFPEVSGKKAKIKSFMKQYVRNLTFTDNSLVLIGTNYFGDLVSWDLKGNPIFQHKLTDLPINSIDSHNNRILVAVGLPPSETRSNFKTQSFLIDLNKKENFLTKFVTPPIIEASFSPDGTRIYSITQNGKFRDLVSFDATGKKLGTFRIGRNTLGPRHLDLSPDGQRIVVIDDRINPASINIWTPKGEKLLRIKKPLDKINDIAMNPLDFVVASGSGSQRVNFASIRGKYMGSIWIGSPVNSIEFTADGKTLVVGTSDDIQLWDYSKRKKIQSITSQKNGISSVSVSKDGLFMAASGGDGKVEIYKKNNKQYRTRKKIKLSKYRVNAVAMTRDGSAIAAGLFREGLTYLDNRGNTLWEVKPLKSKDETGRPVPAGFVCGVTFSETEKVIALISSKRTTIYSSAGEKLADLPVGSGSNICDIKFVNNDQLLLITTGHSIALWDWQKRQRLALYRGHTSRVSSLVVIPETTLFISGSGDTHLRFWNILTGYSAAVTVEKGEWVIYDDYGYFDSSRNGGKILNFTKDLKTYSAEQFALYFNRPDIIYKRLGLATKEYEEHLQSQYKRRINKALINESLLSPDLNPPEIILQGKSRKEDKLTLNLSMHDSHSGLKFYQIYNNNVPLFGRTGKPVHGEKAEVVETIELLNGKNEIEISVFNESGIESYRVSTIEEVKKNKQSNLYFVGLGVSEYKVPELNLRYATNDVLDLSKTITDKYKKYDKVFVRHYLNSQVTSGVLFEIERFLSHATQHDTVVLFLSGHGAYERNALSEYYYLTYDADPRDIQADSISWGSIEELLYKIKPNKKLVLMDTCESGEMEASNQIRALAVAKKNGFISRANQILSDLKNTKRVRRQYLYNKDRYIYNDLVKGSGAVVFSSSSGGEISLESDKLENGLFTNSVINTLEDKLKRADKNKDGDIDVDELIDHVSLSVSRLTGGIQNPTVDRGNPKQNFVFH